MVAPILYSHAPVRDAARDGPLVSLHVFPAVRDNKRKQWGKEEQR